MRELSRSEMLAQWSREATAQADGLLAAVRQDRGRDAPHVRESIRNLRANARRYAAAAHADST